MIHKVIFLLTFIFSVLGLKAQKLWYRVDDPESNSCFFIDTLGQKCPAGEHQKMAINLEFSEGLICINFKKKPTDTNAWGCLNDKGDTIIKGKYLEPFYFYNGIARVAVEPMPLKISLDGIEPDYLYQYITAQGLPINDKLFDGDGSYDMDHNWAVTKSGFQWYILSKSGKLKELSVDYETVDAFSNGFAKCKRMNHYTVYIDTTGWPVIDIPNENFTGEFYNGFAPYSTVDNKYGFMNTKGQPATPCIYEEVSYFNEELAAIKMYNKWGFIDTKGKVVVKPEYDKAEPFVKGLARVFSNGKYGFIDKTGKVVIPIKLNDANGFFSNGLVSISDETQMWGVINNKGELIIKPQFINPFQFDIYGFATVDYTDKHSYKKGKLISYEKALINKHGKVVWCSGEKLSLK